MRHRSRLLLAGSLALLAALPSAPAFADPPPWAPAHGYRAKQHKYVYYPAYEVYYAPESRLWFWIDGGGWRAGASLPGGFAVGGGGVSIVLDADRPYERHGYVVEQYGGRPEKHGKPDKFDKHEKFDKHDKQGRGKHD